MKVTARSFTRSFPLLFLALILLSVPAVARDEWLQVRSKNFLLIGNASEKEIRKVGTRLEQFRETFRQLFTRTSLSASIPTNVIVFKSDNAYKPFKPVRADGKTDNFVAGFFQPGRDVNYITISTEGEDNRTYGTIFHEYVHFILNANFGKSEIPPWFNEGLAEFYETFQIEDDQKVKLGLPQSHHLALLQQNKFIPLEDLFKVTNYELLQTADHSRSIFYAESWALIHYLTINGKYNELSKFLDLTVKKVPQEKAFQEAFQMSYADMEGILRKYVEQATYKYVQIVLKNKLVFDAEMQVIPLGEADENAYLGDLLYHTNRADESESYLTAALRIKPEMSMANTTLGMVKLHQKKYDEARAYLEKAIASDQNNHLAYYDYAYLLSRDETSSLGFVRSFASETSAKIRDALKKAISLQPAFTESYDLLAFVNLVTNEQLDETVGLLKRALQFHPGDQHCTMRLAEIYLRQEKFDESRAIVDRVNATADDPETKGRARELSDQILRMEKFKADQEAQRKEAEKAERSGGTRGMSDEELTRETELEKLRTINRALRKPDIWERRVLGSIQKIDCKNGIVFTVKTDTETLKLTSRDFTNLALNAFVPMPGDSSIGCDSDLSAVKAIITYKARAVSNNKDASDITSIEFVPNDFRILSDEEMRQSIALDPNDKISDNDERQAVARAIGKQLYLPDTNQKREMGYLEQIECTSNGSYFHVRTDSRTLKLFSTSPTAVKIRLFTRELEGMQFGCAMKPINVPAVFIYTEAPDTKARSDGEISSLEFVPRGFRLD